MPKRNLIFARSLNEKQSYYTSIAIILSTISTLIAILTVLAKL
jgi:hypothetical protein